MTASEMMLSPFPPERQECFPALEYGDTLHVSLDYERGDVSWRIEKPEGGE